MTNSFDFLKMNKKNYLKEPVIPLDINPSDNFSQFFEKLSSVSFQGKRLSIAAKIWQKMLTSDVTIFLGIAGALVPAGIRRCIVYTISNRLVDCIVSTGANLYHDIFETLGYYHYQGIDPSLINDIELRKARIDRIYDVFAKEDDFIAADKWIGDFAATLDQNYAYSTREFFFSLGKVLAERCKEDGIVTAAYKANIPIYCPAIADSSIGIALAEGRAKGGNSLKFDVIKDVLETAQILYHSKATGVIFLGGGVPKNFIQQTAVTINLLNGVARGHKYAIQLVVDPPHWGGLSGCTFEEAQSWGKIAQEAEKITVYGDASFHFALLVKLIAEYSVKRERKPNFIMGKELKIVD